LVGSVTEAVEPDSRKEVRKADHYSFHKLSAPWGALPPPPPPPQRATASTTPPDDKKPAEEHRHPPRAGSDDDRLQTLRSYRKARGLCVRCAERWQPGHKCAPALQVHALQEVWNLCQEEFSELEEQDSPAEPAHQVFMMLSSAAVSAQPAQRTMQFQGSIGGLSVVILVDSGSSNSFISTTVADQLTGVRQLQSPGSVAVACGSPSAGD